MGIGLFNPGGLRDSLTGEITGTPLLNAANAIGSMETLFQDLKQHNVKWIYVGWTAQINQEFIQFAIANNIGIIMNSDFLYGSNIPPIGDTTKTNNIKWTMGNVLNWPELDEACVGWYVAESPNVADYLPEVNYWLDYMRSLDPKSRYFLVHQGAMYKWLLPGMHLRKGDKLSIYIPWGTEVPEPWGFWPAYGWDSNWADMSKISYYTKYARNLVEQMYPEITFTPFDFETYTWQDVTLPEGIQLTSLICPKEIMVDRIRQIRKIIGWNEIMYQPYYGWYPDHYRDHSFYGDGVESWKAITPKSPIENLFNYLLPLTLGIGLIYSSSRRG